MVYDGIDASYVIQYLLTSKKKGVSIQRGQIGNVDGPAMRYVMLRSCNSGHAGV